MRRLILRSFHSPGDIVELAVAVRELRAAHTGKFQTDFANFGRCPTRW